MYAERERERERSHFGSSTAPLWRGLFRLSASGGRRGVNQRLYPLGSSRRFSQAVLELNISVAALLSGTP